VNRFFEKGVPNVDTGHTSHLSTLEQADANLLVCLRHDVGA
jgi:hypothetical protein